MFNDEELKKKILIFSFIFLVVFVITVGCSTCFAATPGNPNNVFYNVYSMNEYTTIQDVLDDSLFVPSTEEINSFLNDKKYKNKYLISYCNSGNCEATIDSRSVDMIGFNDDVDVDFIQNGRQLTLKFSGKPESQVYFYLKPNALTDSYSVSLNFIDYKKEYYNFRTVIPVSSYGDVNDRLGSLLVDNLFVKLLYYIRPLILVVLSLIGFLILLFWGVPLCIKFFKNLVM